MIIIYKGCSFQEYWQKDLTVGKAYLLFDYGLSTSYIIDDAAERVHIGDFRISAFEIFGGNE